MTMSDPVTPSPEATAHRAERADRARDISVAAKLSDAATPGAIVSFDPDEAERAGAFVEDALSADEASEAEEGLYGDDDYLPSMTPANDDHTGL